VRQGASWTAADHRQLTVAAGPDPSIAAWVPSASLRLSGPGGCSPQTKVCPAERPAGLERSGVLAVLDTASRHATASVAAVQQTVSTHPVSASGIRLSSRPVSGHLGWSSRGPALGRLLSTRPASSRLLSTRRCPAVRCLPLSVRTRPAPPMLRRWRWGPGRAGRATLTTRTGGGPVAAGPSTARRRSRRPGRGRRCRRRVGRWEVGGGPGPPGWVRAAAAALVAERPGRPGRRPERPSQAAARWARVQAAARGGCTGRVAGVFGWGRDHGGWSSPGLTPGWAAPAGPGEVPAGMGVWPQRGPG
jgi:hypothetical protein